jgi:hypothetical protein
VTDEPLSPGHRWAITVAAFHVIRNVGGACGVALAATLLSRRSQYHQTTLVGHVNVWSVDTAARLEELRPTRASP